MSQQVPSVSEVDVKRVIHRDFGFKHIDKVYDLLTSNASPLWAHSKDKSCEPHLGKMFNENRVFLSILKLANGKIGEIKRQLEVANYDPRDVIGSAEYPRFMRIGFVGVDKLDAVARQKLIDDDYRDYMSWLNAE